MADDDVTTPDTPAAPRPAASPHHHGDAPKEAPAGGPAGSPVVPPADAATAPAPTGANRPDDYPAEWEADVVLRDGSVAHVRPIVPADAEGIRAFHAQQSAESIYLRFFAPIKEISERDMHRFTHVDYDTRAAIVATIRDVVIGIARYDCLSDPSIAEVAFNI